MPGQIGRILNEAPSRQTRRIAHGGGSYTAELFLLGSGGPGHSGGGGGACPLAMELTIHSGMEYPVIVGASTPFASPLTIGNPSYFGQIIAIGGGHGGGAAGDNHNIRFTGGDGSSGGGGGFRRHATMTGVVRDLDNGGRALTGGGHGGGSYAVTNSEHNGGGGGAGGNGLEATNLGGGDGGPGIEWPPGSNSFYGGGGGGGSGGIGGIGGGGDHNAPGLPNTGGGGGGDGGSGGSGICVVRYAGRRKGHGGIISFPGDGFFYHKFLGNGTFIG